VVLRIAVQRRVLHRQKRIRQTLRQTLHMLGVVLVSLLALSLNTISNGTRHMNNQKRRLITPAADVNGPWTTPRHGSYLHGHL
jgi:hypothetical protein